MMLQARTSRWFKWPLALLAFALALYGVMLIYASGQTLLALSLLITSALSLWTYTSQRTHALRYLLPGIGTALIFVIFPMLYTMGMGFTNQSSRNLLDREQARAELLEASVWLPHSERDFSLYAEGDRLRLVLAATPAEPLLASAPLLLNPEVPASQAVVLSPQGAKFQGEPLTLRQTVPLLPALRALKLQPDDGAALTLASLRSFAKFQPLYLPQADGALMDRVTHKLYRADLSAGFYASADGDRLQPGFLVNVGWRNFTRIVADEKFREPFVSVFAWTVIFAALSVILAAGLGLFLAVLLKWEDLEFRGVYRLVLFLPYAVPGFISILVFKGLFNQNLGEINLILHGLFGIRPAWFSDPLLAKLMLLIVNTWLGFPYMMVLCSGLVSSIPADIYEAAAVAGAGPWTTFRRLTLPLILKPLTPLLISAFAFNFNNFVLISLLTGGRPDYTDAITPAGTTDILVSYTWRMAFQDSGQEFGLAAAISTVIFLIVAAITLVQMRFTRAAAGTQRS